jgi:hypothetical protein
MKKIKSANFMTPYDKKVYRTADLNGKILSFGKNIEKGNFSTSIYFEIDYSSELVPGSYIELFLKLSSSSESIAVPKSAVMEEFGSYFVFVKISDSEYEKRGITLGPNDGINYCVKSGLEAGEAIAIAGAYRLKLASMGTSMPSHGHTH